MYKKIASERNGYKEAIMEQFVFIGYDQKAKPNTVVTIKKPSINVDFDFHEIPKVKILPSVTQIEIKLKIFWMLDIHFTTFF